MSDERTPGKIKAATKKKVMDLLARRDHSEKELRQKLKERFSEEDGFVEAVNEAIEFAKDNRWLGDPSTLSQKMADILHRKNKGIHYINNYLREKGLPDVGVDRELELEKAMSVIKNKYKENFTFDRDERARVGRFLAGRGFDSETVRKVIYEKL